MEPERRAQLVVGSVMLLLLGGAVVGLVALGNRTFSRGIKVSVDFEHVDNLKEGAEARISALRVGRVLAIRHGVGAAETRPLARVRVDLWIERALARHVRTNSIFYVNAKGVIGERYVEVGAPRDADPGPVVVEGAVLRGVDSPKLDRMLQFGYENLRATVALTQELGPDVRELGQAIDSLERRLQRDLPEPRLSALLESGRRAVAAARDLWDVLQVATEEGRLLGRVGAALGAARDRLEPHLDALSPRVDSVSRQADDLLALFPPERRDRLARAFERLAAAAKRAEETSALADKILDGLAKGRGTAGRMLQDPEIVDEIKETHRILKESPWRAVGRPK